MVLIEPESAASPILSTHYIMSIIDKYAEETALLLLPGVQFYTGQLFDMVTITDYARMKGIMVGWDLAHAVGNVPMQLHDWDVDFAVWCTVSITLFGSPLARVLDMMANVYLV